MRLVIDDLALEAESPRTILEAAREAGISIPTLCYHPALEPYGACRLCSVEVEKGGRKRIVTACNYPVEEGLTVRTSSAEVIEIRKMILELLLARCPEERRINELAREHGISETRFRLEDKRCILCGLCSRVCEELVGVSAINAMNRGIEREVDAPYKDLSEDCIGCGSCALVCPTGAIKGMKNIFPLAPGDIREIEGRFLVGSKDPQLGIYQEIFSGRSSIPGQDGGMVTTLLASALNEGLIDSAIVVLRRGGMGAEAVLVDELDGILSAKGTKYVRVPMASRLREALLAGKRKIAVVGTPCQVRAIRKMQLNSLEEEAKGLEITIIGLFCFESFDCWGLRDHIKESLNIELEDADKVQIANGIYKISIGESGYSIPVKDLKDEVREGCNFCDDFASRLADISVGSVGSPEGYSTVIVRSERGRRLLDGQGFTRSKVAKEEIAKLASLKKRRADKSSARIVDGLDLQSGRE